MAANQTIIQAAGQRYAPIKTDYSGYIQGLSSIANALIGSKNKMLEESKTLGALNNPESVIAARKNDFTAVRNKKEWSLEKKVQWFKDENETQKDITTNIDEIKKKAPSMSSANDPLVQSFVFNATSAFKERTIVVDGYPMSAADNTLNPETEEAFNPFVGNDPITGHMQVIGLDGTLGSPKDMISSDAIITVEDGVEVMEVFNSWKKMPSVKNRYTPEDKTPFSDNLSQLRDDLKVITKGPRGKEKLMSFMVDHEITNANNEEMNFVDYVLQNMEDTSLRDQFNSLIDEDTDGFGINDERIIAVKKEIVRQYISADFINAQELFVGFQVEFANTYKN